MQVARRVFANIDDLNLLNTCELSPKILDIPSWVPDWSSALKISSFPYTNWSACGWISAQITFLNDDAMRVARVMVTQVTEVIETNLDEYKRDYDAVLVILRSITATSPSEPNADTCSLDYLETHCRALLADSFSNSDLPGRHVKPDLARIAELLKLIVSSTKTWTGFQESAFRWSKSFLSHCHHNLVGRCFIRGKGGYIGLASGGAQTGDVLCVLLGCRYPVLLRPRHSNDEKSGWHVVGIGNVPALMHGEVIYWGKLPKDYRSVKVQDWMAHTPVDDWSVAWYDRQTDFVLTDAAKLLSDAGIVVEATRCRPCVRRIARVIASCRSGIRGLCTCVNRKASFSTT